MCRLCSSDKKLLCVEGFLSCDVLLTCVARTLIIMTANKLSRRARNVLIRAIYGGGSVNGDLHNMICSEQRSAPGRRASGTSYSSTRHRWHFPPKSYDMADHSLHRLSIALFCSSRFRLERRPTNFFGTLCDTPFKVRLAARLGAAISEMKLAFPRSTVFCFPIRQPKDIVLRRH